MRQPACGLEGLCRVLLTPAAGTTMVRGWPTLAGERAAPGSSLDTALASFHAPGAPPHATLMAPFPTGVLANSAKATGSSSASRSRSADSLEESISGDSCTVELMARCSCVAASSSSRLLFARTAARKADRAGLPGPGVRCTALTAETGKPMALARDELGTRRSRLLRRSASCTDGRVGLITPGAHGVGCGAGTTGGGGITPPGKALGTLPSLPSRCSIDPPRRCEGTRIVGVSVKMASERYWRRPW
jgi:hypothetical protein